MRVIILTVCGLLLMAVLAWAEDAEEQSGKQSGKDDDRAVSQLQIIGGSYFGTGDEFLYTGVTADPGAVVPESVSDGEPAEHLHGSHDDHQTTDGEYQGRYDLLYYGQDSILGPLWGVPGEAIPETGVEPDDPRLTDPHVEQPTEHKHAAPAEEADGVRRTKDGRIIIFKSSADMFYDD